ncbi:hypothetical protein [Pseudoduganella buxea]|uniref:Uncharacterized protein n=1 Tax=Pseudoduganella buxea TaxID=1949069 RepID=A0A6I3STE6_9BURK|nr:hypothetical protein [Pseudoduganella buxea]MTV52418.1 hypothetical protein [Pseudoduganella buxea]GGC18061.1 hypothetical protein GCM10011572_44230 [Pseudoduganella buxea]
MNAFRILKLTMSVFAAVTAASVTNPAHAQATVPLVAFYSPSAGDFFTTSEPAWTCRLQGCSGEFGDYQLYGMQGHVFNPDLPQPAGTLPLWHWFSEAREDNLLTTHPGWNPADGLTRESGEAYQFVRLAGYVKPVGSTGLPLTNFWKLEDRDNAALTTARFITRYGDRVPHRVPPGYGESVVEGVLPLPSSSQLEDCHRAEPPIGGDGASWLAPANTITPWAALNSFLDGDVIRITGPIGKYKFNAEGHEVSVRGLRDLATGGAFPAPGIQKYALLARVTKGRVFVRGQGWYEANQWFRALGESGNEPGGCILYDAQGSGPGKLELGFNDGYILDNSGGAMIRIHQWW